MSGRLLARREVARYALRVLRPTSRDGPTKFQRYRAAQRARGLKVLRIWAPDPNAAGFAVEAQRQAELLRGAPEEAEALTFIAAAADMEDPGREARR